jgi:predicted ATPase
MYANGGRGVPVISANPRDGSRLLRFLVDAPNTDPEIGHNCLARARARGTEHRGWLRLTRREVDAMIDRVAGNKLLLAGVRQDIIERTDGIPLFVEEMTKAVLEAESQSVAERTAAAVPSPVLAIPATLQASLMARLDRLGASKEVAQIGAAIGREFSYDLLAAVSLWHGNQLVEALAQLEMAGLIFARGASTRLTYTFKHALVQHTAYGTLLRGKRQQLHARIAEAILRLFPERGAVEPELLAHHYTEAAQIEDAIEYWRRAGTRAIERSANVEAIAHLSKGLQLIENLPEDTARDRQEVALRTARSWNNLAERGPQGGMVSLSEIRNP